MRERREGGFEERGGKERERGGKEREREEGRRRDFMKISNFI